MSELISYEELRKMQNAERDNHALQAIDASFFDKVKEYIAAKKKLIDENEGKDNTFSHQTFEKGVQELKNTQKILLDICSRRQKKILLHAITNMTARVHNTEAMLQEEEELYNKLISVLKENERSFMSKLEDREERVKLRKDDKNLKLLRVIDVVPSFAWSDGKNYGPFSKEDIVNIPHEVGEILIKQGKATEIIEDKGGA
jgi:DNA replication initiation complex subunit (GINS family)